ncbi:MAG: hypothetical protein P8X64_08360 [Anaerolineales bacterium]|jgi:hypothetical protein
MITPAGTECPFYYEDFHRGHHQQECRLIDRTPGGGTYTPDLCARCPAPRILMANACPHMVLEARVISGFLGLRRRVRVSAYCTKSLEDVKEPEVGCSQCHRDIPVFSVGPEEE